MLFLIRAAVVIGGLSYLALLRDRPDAVPTLPAVSPQAPAHALAAAFDAMPAEPREQLVREGVDGLVRRLGTTRPASADTLAEADRQPPWRGVASR
ncbi:hypothetical protein ASG60_04480 [Methylobacterium sp. Leaf469]|jgi:hypothetical protein|uniref:hypothetical protein n=1 Tax=unclassified Methylobacterium TaxID=2615210 RepID=UPI0007015F96|nr:MULTISPECIES: hypothetical protein [unclassified Methylobacterium]KQO72851.1 hypothetical protein ASF22_00405 [Methylobacterium sp. Leaf87]KQT98970.1 hypothetical protein ASG60_04480 [Methylobacterium sp. Leaf469]USU30443.1 hypothetical protein NG677_13725 [Methylobacterium sp. OTU13CASTA1]